MEQKERETAEKRPSCLLTQDSPSGPGHCFLHLWVEPSHAPPAGTAPLRRVRAALGADGSSLGSHRFLDFNPGHVFDGGHDRRVIQIALAFVLETMRICCARLGKSENLV
jgi:hypothetical protein